MSAERAEPGAGRTSATPAEAVRLRRMTVRHLPEVVRVEQATSPRPWTRATFVRELEDPASRRYVVACPPSRRRLVPAVVVGFAGVHRRPDAAHITTIAVAPEHQRHGVGGQLLGWLLQTAVGLGCGAATLEVRASNRIARRLYARAGFVEAGVRPGYYRQPTEDAVIMWRALPRPGEPRPGVHAEGGT